MFTWSSLFYFLFLLVGNQALIVLAFGGRYVTHKKSLVSSFNTTLKNNASIPWGKFTSNSWIWRVFKAGSHASTHPMHKVLPNPFRIAWDVAKRQLHLTIEPRDGYYVHVVLEVKVVCEVTNVGRETLHVV